MVDEMHSDNGDSSGDEFDVDSLFDGDSPITGFSPHSIAHPPRSDASPVIVAARRTAPSIPGIFFDPSILISQTLARELSDAAAGYFRSDAGTGLGSVNQVMLFGRASVNSSGLPPFLDKLILTLSVLLRPHLPLDVYELLFPTGVSASRQAILNHYTPGEGITPHVDLLTRFADGIVAVSLGSGTVMTFRRVMHNGVDSEEERHDVYLPERSLLVLTGDARYKWSHGIEARSEDCIENAEEKIWVERGARVSITLRWLLPGADIVGGVER